MASLQSLTDNILPFADGAPEAAAVWAYRRALREFFTKTLAWRTTLSFASIAAEAQTALNPGADLEVFDAAQCWYGEAKLIKGTEPQRNTELGVGATTADPKYFWIKDVNSLVVSPTAAAGTTLKLLSIVRPTQLAATVDDAILSKYGDMIEFGALAYLLRMAKKPWTDYGAAQANDDKFQFDIDRVTVLGPDGGVGTPRTVRYGGY